MQKLGNASAALATLAGPGSAFWLVLQYTDCGTNILDGTATFNALEKPYLRQMITEHYSPREYPLKSIHLTIKRNNQQKIEDRVQTSF